LPLVKRCPDLLRIERWHDAGGIVLFLYHQEMPSCCFDSAISEMYSGAKRSTSSTGTTTVGQQVDRIDDDDGPQETVLEQRGGDICGGRKLVFDFEASETAMVGTSDRSTPFLNVEQLSA
jgi:hypothetical protein